MAQELTDEDVSVLADTSIEVEVELARSHAALHQGVRRGLADVLGGAAVDDQDVEWAVLKAFAQWLGKPPDQRQLAYARHIARQRGRDLGRHILRRPTTTATGDIGSGPDDDSGLDPLEAALQQELLDDALACLDTITGKQRAYVVDVIMNGQSESDWADERDISQQAANKTKLRAIRRLRDCVKARAEGNDGEDD